MSGAGVGVPPHYTCLRARPGLMGKKSKTRDEPRSRTRGEDTGTRGRGTQQRSGGRENEREERPRPQIYSYVNRKQKFLETYPFGVDVRSATSRRFAAPRGPFVSSWRAHWPQVCLPPLPA